MPLADAVGRSILSLTSEQFIILVTLLGYYFLSSRDTFLKAALMLALTLVLNPYLKSIFQVPLNPSLNKIGWAFPSGHMQIVTVFWVWIAWEIKNKWLTLAACALLASVAWALTHFNYHDAKDILGALAFGSATLIAYRSIHRSRFASLVLIAFAIPLFFLTPNAINLPFMWVGIGALVGLPLGAWVGKNYIVRKLHVIVALGSLIIIELFFAQFAKTPLLNLVHYSALAFNLTGGFLILTPILKHLRRPRDKNPSTA